MSTMPVIVLDAGHGGHDPGALGPRGERESDVALAVVLRMAEMLRSAYQVILTRADDSFLDLAARARKANDVQADAFISIHCNSSDNRHASGFEVFTTPGETASDKLAIDEFTAYAAYFPHKRKRMDLSDADEDKEARFTVLTRTRMRAVLFELEFISHPEGARFLTDPANQDRMAEALVCGIVRHFEARHGAEVNAALRAKLREIHDLIQRP